MHISLQRILKGILLMLLAVFLITCTTTRDQGRIIVQIKNEEPEYISPGSSPGVEDQLMIEPFVEPTGEAVVHGYRVDIISSDEELIRTVGEEVVDGQAAVVTIPQRIVWDGKNAGDEIVPDGIYSYTLTVWDDVLGSWSSDPKEVMVDGTPPIAKVTIGQKLFSPNDDGHLDTLQVDQAGSKEPVWQASIIDARYRTVWQETISDSTPTDLRWSGRDEEGRSLPDGEYTYIISGSDHAGNVTVVSIPGITIDTSRTPVTIGRNFGVFSPNGDGRRDRIQFIPTALVEEGLERWTIEVLNSANEAVYTRTDSAPLPEYLSYDGQTDAGSILKEGEYRTRITLEYEKGDRPVAYARPFTVDLTPPESSVGAAYEVFSPNGDGNKERLKLTQSAVSKHLWTGRIIDADGNPVRTYSWEGPAPESIQWDGLNDSGEFVPDGTYRYTLSTTDRAGNRSLAETAPFRKDTSEIPEIALFPEVHYFSPDGDGTNDSFRTRVELTETEDIVWSLFVVRNADGEAMLRSRTENSVPKLLEWDGTDQQGATSPNGEYTAQLKVRYRNGNTPTSSTAPFYVDVEDPQLSIAAEHTVFSPDGDGRRDTMTIAQSSSEEQKWQAKIVDQSDDPVKTMSWTGSVEDVVWDGTGDEGETVPDGEYTYVVSATDRAGNSIRKRIDPITVDTRKTPIEISVEQSAFSPNGDRTKDTLTLSTDVAVQEGIRGWEFYIFDTTSGEAVYTETHPDARTVPTTIEWNGQATELDAATAPEGEYDAELGVYYRKGNHPVNRTDESIRLDTTPPTVSLKADYRLFSPNGDGNRDSITIDQVSSREPQWHAEITASDGSTVYTQSWTGMLEDFTWQGRDDAGNFVADGRYRYTVSATDRAGNTTKSALSDIRIDTAPTPIDVDIERDGFSPNGDGQLEYVSINPKVQETEGITSWTLSMQSTSGNPVYTFSGGEDSSVPESLLWDGNAKEGTAADGEYVAVLSVSYRKGNRPTVNSENTVVLDTTDPKASLRISPQPFSPDGDGVEDTTILQLDAADQNGIKSWSVRILDPAGNEFRYFSGTGIPPASIEWDGSSDTGDSVQAAQTYEALLRVTDKYDNREIVRKAIETDIFLIREDGKRKIRITSIYFEPDTADYTTLEDPEKVRQNRETLDKLAEYLKEYSNYQIRIEGHAVLIYWRYAERAAEEQEEVLLPLSKDRAEAVKDALVERGIDADRISTAGIGGSDPIVPHGDLDERWKNRRVEFILTEK